MILKHRGTEDTEKLSFSLLSNSSVVSVPLCFTKTASQVNDEGFLKAIWRLGATAGLYSSGYGYASGIFV